MSRKPVRADLVDLRIKFSGSDRARAGRRRASRLSGMPIPPLNMANDYRTWLAGALKELRRRHPAKTARALAARLEVDPAHLSRVFAARKHLSLRHHRTIAEFIGLSPTETKELECLMRCGVARDPEEARRAAFELQAHRGAFGSRIPEGAREYFGSWLHPAMRGLLGLAEFRGTGWERLASLFRRRVSPGEARDSVDLLRRLSLVSTSPGGILRPDSRTSTFGYEWAGNDDAEFQRQSLALASELVESVPPGERDLSTLTFPASAERIEELRDMIRLFRSEVAAWSRGLPEKDRVMQLNIHLLPVADAPPSRGRRHAGDPS